MLSGPTWGEELGEPVDVCFKADVSAQMMGATYFDVPALAGGVARSGGTRWAITLGADTSDSLGATHRSPGLKLFISRTVKDTVTCMPPVRCKIGTAYIDAHWTLHSSKGLLGRSTWVAASVKVEAIDHK